jgi:rod shape-determining protein MreD
MTLKRALGFIAIGFFALVVTTSAQAISPLRLATPEVMLLIVLYLGLGGAGANGAMSGYVGVALVLGYLGDLFAGSPKGLQSLSLAVCMVVTRAASSRLIVISSWQVMTVAALATTGYSLLLLGLASTMFGEGAWAELRVVPPTVALTALLAPLQFAVLRRFDRRLLPDPTGLRLVA